MTVKRNPAIFCLIASLVFLIFTTACSDTTNEKALTPDRDLAETLASALAVNTGGLLDQMADLNEFLTPTANKMPDGGDSRYITMNKTYNEATQEWTITYEKVRGVQGEAGYAHIYRNYILKYMNTDGNPQKFYVTGADTARTVRFKVMRGHGDHATRRIHNRLDSLHCDWTISNAHLQYVQLSGFAYRAGEDTISGWNKLRRSNHYMTLNFSDFQVRRAQHMNAYQYHNGSVTGTCNAEVTFINGSPYSETTISRPVNIIIGSGRGDITLGDKQFTADLAAGELID
jgi:hypothetical protein